MKIFDCFKFFNELELLDLRLMTLDHLVDYFVLVEANKTHTGKPKEFLFEKNKELFKPYLDKIIYVKVEDLPQYSQDNIWLAENFQRNCIIRGLGNVKYGDKIIISDVDEIPNPDTLTKYLDQQKTITMVQHLFYYHVNCLQNQPWCGSVMATYPNFGSPQELRNYGRFGSGNGIATLGLQLGNNPVPEGGWHYSFMGGAERIRTKVENIAESHLIIDKIGDNSDIESKINSQADLWDRTEIYTQKKLIDITAPGMAPKPIKQFIKKYPYFFNGDT